MKIRKSELLKIGLAFIGGASAFFYKAGSINSNPFIINFIRFGLGYFIIFTFLTKKHALIKFDSNLLLGSLIGAFNIIFFIFGIYLTNAHTAQAIYAGIPILTLIMSSFFIKQKQSPKTIFFITTYLVLGLILVVYSNFRLNQITDFRGVFVLTVGAILLAAYNILIKYKFSKFSSQDISFAFISLNFLLSSLFMAFTSGNVSRTILRFSIPEIISLFFWGIFGTGIYYIFYSKNFKTNTPLNASGLLIIQQIVGVFLAVFILKEKIDLIFIVGMILILLQSYV